MERRQAIRAGLFLMLGGISLPGRAEITSSPTDPAGDLQVHDPSTVVRCGDTYWLFSTGPGIKSHYSADFVRWRQGPKVFAVPPAWTQQAVPGFRDYFWAPEIILLNRLYHLYYAVSTFGSRISAIGLATSPTLDPARSDYRWTDAGLVLQSGNTTPFNAIDPALLQDDDGRLWMSFGSFAQGIMLVELDAKTGMRKARDSPVLPLASHSTIEASYLHRRGPWYYLFANWGFCCRGVKSTYNIRIGRARSVTGPYLDRDGVDMINGGGSLLLGNEGTRIGPGQAAIATVQGVEWFTYHFYDATRRGHSRLGVRRLRWSADGWPVLST